MLTANALMLRFYMKAMQEHGAAKATVYNFAINYLSSVSHSQLLIKFHFLHQKHSYTNTLL